MFYLIVSSLALALSHLKHYDITDMPATGCAIAQDDECAP